jgi:hypothetical protein
VPEFVLSEINGRAPRFIVILPAPSMFAI